EWVYNEADIDAAKVVWARDMDATSNAELLRYFQGRRVWLIEPDSAPSKLVAFHESSQPFPFVKLGTPDITVLRSPQAIREQVLKSVAVHGYREPYQFSCDQWNFFFTEVTGVAAPDAVSQVCAPRGDRSTPLPFTQWFSW